MSASFEGGCLCGAVRYECNAEPVVAGHCHCVDCRRSSGTGHCSHMGVPKDSVTVTGVVSVYERPSDTGNVVGRAFCPTCGAAIYSTNSAMPDRDHLSPTRSRVVAIGQPERCGLSIDFAMTVIFYLHIASNPCHL